VSAADHVQPRQLSRRQFDISFSTERELRDDEWYHGTTEHRSIMADRHIYPSPEGSSGPGLYLTKDEGWAREYGTPLRARVDLEGAKIGTVITGKDELEMGDDPSYDALIHRRHADDHDRMLVLRDTNRITRVAKIP
jgi:hypothetical protein